MGKKRSKRHKPTFIAQWREHRGITQAQLAERLVEAGFDYTQASVSRLENGVIPYSQELLEAVAIALSCDPADLLMRDPTKPGIWTIWDQIPPTERPQASRVLETFIKKAS